MMGTKKRCFAPLVNVSLEELVPQDQFYRHLERMLDLSWGLARPTNCAMCTTLRQRHSWRGRLIEIVEV